MSIESLKTLLKRVGADGTAAVDADALRELAAACSPNASEGEQNLALLCLSTAVDAVQRQGGSADEQAKKVKTLFDPLVTSAVASETLEPGSLAPAVSLLAALASLAPAGVVALLTQSLGAAVESDSPSAFDPLGILLELAELPSALQPALAALLSALAGAKAGRETVRSRAYAWIAAAAEDDTVQGDTKVLCAVALSKIGREDAQVGEAEEARLARDEESSRGEEKLAKTLAAHIASSSSSNTAALLPSLEGLSVLSTRPVIRDILVADAQFIKALLALSPVPKAVGGSLPVTPRASIGSLDDAALAPVDAALCYGLSTILANFVARRPILSEHDQQMARLRRMAISGKTAAEAEDEDPHERDDAVSARCAKLLSLGVVPAMAGLVRADSLRVKEAIGRLSLGLVEDRQNRLPFVREGGFKALSQVLRDLLDRQPDAALPAAQALAKLAITTQPDLLFPPPAATNALNALKPLYLLLLDPSSSLLHQFEALMALTNLASIDQSIAERIVKASFAPPETEELRGRGRQTGPIPVIGKVEELLLDDNTLVRRAATELVCNVAASEAGFEHFTGPKNSRLGVLLLLTDVDDRPTRLAASGALAVLTESPVACKTLLDGAGIAGPSKRTPWERLGDLFEPNAERAEEDGDVLETVSSAAPDPELVHRGTVVVSNLLEYVKGLGTEGEELLHKAKATELGKRIAAVAQSLMRDPPPGITTSVLLDTVRLASALYEAGNVSER